MDSFRYKIIREIQLKNNDFFVLIYGFIIEEADSEHSRAIRIEPGCTYKLRYSGTDTNWYEGWCILSNTEKLKDYGWQNIGSLKEVTINNTYETGIYLYINLKYGSAGATAVTDTMLTEFISHFTMERVM